MTLLSLDSCFHKKMNTQDLKQKFGIIGNNVLLERAVDIARQVAPTDLNVVISGESGTGKEAFPQIIHQNSARKHGSNSGRYYRQRIIRA